MKKLVLLFLPAVFMACSGVEQHREAIESVSAEWDAVTADVTELQGQLGTDMTELQTAANEYMIPAETLATLKPEQLAAWEGAQQALKQTTQGYAALRTEIAEFSKAWSSESAKVQSLKDGLSAGKIEGDVAAQIDNLKTLIAQGQESVAAWQTRYEDVKKSAQAALDTMKNAHASLSTATADK